MWRYLTTLTSIGLLIELYFVKVIQSSTAAPLIVDLISAEVKSQPFHLSIPHNERQKKTTTIA